MTDSAPDWGMVDEDPETGAVIPCVVCAMNSQRGGTGCCSQQCLDALHEAYPSGPKLTPAQGALLLDIRDRSDVERWIGNPTAKVLVREGLAEWGRPTIYGARILVITAAGRSALS